jgi:hypothetical protein
MNPMVSERSLEEAIECALLAYPPVPETPSVSPSFPA